MRLDPARSPRIALAATDAHAALDLPIIDFDSDGWTVDSDIHRAAASDVPIAALAGQSVDLNAARGADTLVFRGLLVKTVAESNDRVALNCALPASVHITGGRHWTNAARPGRNDIGQVSRGVPVDPVRAAFAP